MSKPLCIDLYAGLGGWAEGFLAEGYDVIGFDIERHRYPKRQFSVDVESQKSMHGKNANGTTLINRALEQISGFHRAPFTGEWDEYPGQLVLQDALTLHGSQFRNARCIVASPPCTEYSYMAMPWSRAKQIAGALREECPFPECYTGSRTLAELNALFNACFRIQREACEAANGIKSWGADCEAFGSCGRHAITIGHFGKPVCAECSKYGWETYGPPNKEGPQYRYIPMVVENVKGAQPWVGPAKAHYGSYYFWGDVGSVNGAVVAGRLQMGNLIRAKGRAMKHNPDGTGHPQGSWFKIADSANRGSGDALKVPGFRFDGSGGSFQTAAVNGVTAAAQRYREENGTKLGDACDEKYRLTQLRPEGVKQGGSGAAWFDKALDERRKEATKCGGSWFGKGNDMSLMRQHSSKSDSRKAASAQIAKIPFPLASYIARSFAQVPA